MNIKTVFVFLIFLIVSSLSFGQNFKKEKRIYMLDITKSMFGSDGGDNVFGDVKEALYKGISDIQDPETIVTIIPFQATHTYEILDSWTFKAGEAAKFADVKRVIDSYSKKTVHSGYTDIYSALETAKKHISRDRINYIFLLTDGEQSAVPSASTKHSKIDFSAADLMRSLSNWCQYSQNRDAHLFYVMLTEAAVNSNIVDVVEKECNAYVAKGTNINIAFIKPTSKDVKINLHDNPEKVEIGLTANNWKYIDSELMLGLELENNTLFELKNTSTEVQNKKITIYLKRKNNLSFEDLKKQSPIESSIALKLSTKSKTKIINPNINIKIRNKKERVLTLEFSDDE